jgi:hypothetical protein
MTFTESDSHSHMRVSHYCFTDSRNHPSVVVYRFLAPGF